MTKSVFFDRLQRGNVAAGRGLPTVKQWGCAVQFCKDCGGVLNLFGKNERDLCSSCVQSRKKQDLPPEPPSTPPSSSGDPDLQELLKESMLVIENGRVVLRSKEGWELWSGNNGSSIEMKSLMARAGRIYKIRLKRQKN